MEDPEIRPTIMDMMVRIFFFYLVFVFITGGIIHLLCLIKLAQLVPLEPILNLFRELIP